MRHHKHLEDVYNQVPADYWDLSFNTNFLQRLWHSGTQRVVRNSITLLPTGAKLLDVGCGSGFTLAKVTSERPDLQVYGVDVTTHLIEYARTIRPYITFAVASGERLPFSDKEFDCVTYLDIIEHLVDPKGALKESRRVLKDGGMFIVLVVLEHHPIFRIIWWLWTQMRGKVWHGAHLHVFTKKSLRELVEQAEFKIEEIKTVNLGMSVVLRARKNH